ncbi:MAG: hypothetical protein A2Y24_08420 [Clostridiales bacterium GWE2_32_10]|nr:MAG: hypothetical protein A2Y24_08420 [Clostridiales bacterium GWE2_32_10]HBY21125.1 hypothetical protein [Clostridiales bacterium]
MSTKLLNKGYIAYEVEEDKIYIVIGELREEMDENFKRLYIIDIKEEKVMQLVDLGYIQHDFNILPVMNIEHGYYQRHVRLPAFITMRVPDRRRTDINEILQRFGLEYYDAFEILLRNKGRSLDEWRVLRDLGGYNII